MATPPNPIESPRHRRVRSFFRIAGPSLVVLGVTLMAVGMASFFAAFGGSGRPRLFWCAFLGMPLLGLGMVFCKFGYFGAAARYLAAEAAPVARDTLNYLVDGTTQSVKSVARAVAEGVREAEIGKPPDAPKSDSDRS